MRILNVAEKIIFNNDKWFGANVVPSLKCDIVDVLDLVVVKMVEHKIK